MNSASDVGTDRLVIAAFLDLEADHWLAELRHRFDPLTQQVPAHVTLVHPVRVPEEWPVVSRHVASVAGSFRAFQLVCQGVTGHADEYLFLNVKRGNDELIALRDALYSGVLASSRSDSVTYLPHVTVGRLGSVQEFRAALTVSRTYGDRVSVVIDAIHVYAISVAGQRTVLASHSLRAGVSSAAAPGLEPVAAEDRKAVAARLGVVAAQSDDA